MVASPALNPVEERFDSVASTKKEKAMTTTPKPPPPPPMPQMTVARLIEELQKRTPEMLVYFVDETDITPVLAVQTVINKDWAKDGVYLNLEVIE